MIDLYTWNTSNGRKVQIMMEELGIPYTLHPVNIGQREQFAPEYVAINPNAKIPAIVDHDGPGGQPINLAESGAILIYLGEKTGKFYPSEPRARYEVIQWLMFQMSAVGPTFGQLHHFLRSAFEEVPYANERFGKEARRLYGVLDARLADHEYLVDEYTIADIATYPWVSRYDWQEISLEDFPNVKRWYEILGQRPAVQRGMNLL